MWADALNGTSATSEAAMKVRKIMGFMLSTFYRPLVFGKGLAAKDTEWLRVMAVGHPAS
ncbi:MAG: hypothetical protein NVS9B10_29160 [Nevskia sp.]